ncbi:hypothetical protein [Hydrogenophaga defluvii]|uniref:Uncharacterized protein n=1 Tax=Hydrogenophaga defluvii TaxID=249410 RepID=A0ABW2SCV8_9BURK
MKHLNPIKNEKELLNLCKTTTNTAIKSLNSRRAPFATTYSDAFCKQAVELVILYRNQGIADPVDRMAKQFQKHGILTCRNAEMSYTNAKYFYEKFLAPIIAKSK